MLKGFDECAVPSSTSGIKAAVNGHLDFSAHGVRDPVELLFGHPGLEMIVRGLEDFAYGDGPSVRVGTAPELDGFPEWRQLGDMDVQARHGWGCCGRGQVCGVEIAEVAVLAFPSRSQHGSVVRGEFNVPNKWRRVGAAIEE